MYNYDKLRLPFLPMFEQSNQRLNNIKIYCMKIPLDHELYDFYLEPFPDKIKEEKIQLKGWFICIKLSIAYICVVRDDQTLIKSYIKSIESEERVHNEKHYTLNKNSFGIDLNLHQLSLGKSELFLIIVLKDGTTIPLGLLRVFKQFFYQPSKKTFFIHVAKTAGSSFNDFLSSYFYGERHCEQFFANDRCLNYTSSLNTLENFDFISGHLTINHFFNNFKQSNYYLLTILREPIYHLVSQINWVIYISENVESAFFKNHPEAIRNMSLKMRQLDLTNYLNVIDLLLEYHQMFKNCQSQYFITSVNESLNAKSIIEQLKHFDLVGLTEFYERFVNEYIKLTKFEGVLKPIIYRSNKNTNPRLNPEEVFGNKNLMLFLRDYNSVDIQVYNYFRNKLIK